MDLSENRTQYEPAMFTLINNTSEQTIVTFTNLRDLIYINLDLDPITVNTLLKLYEKTDDSVFSLLPSTIFNPTASLSDYDGKIVEVKLDGGGRDMKLTIESNPGAEPMNVDIIYRISTTTRP